MLLTEETCDGKCAIFHAIPLFHLCLGVLWGGILTRVNNQACRLKPIPPLLKGFGDAFVSRTCPCFQSITPC